MDAIGILLIWIAYFALACLASAGLAWALLMGTAKLEGRRGRSAAPQAPAASESTR